MLRVTLAMCVLVLLLQAAIDAGQLAKNRGQQTPTNKDAGQLAKNRGQKTPTNKDAGQLAKNRGQQTPTNKDAGQLAKNRGQQTPTNKGVPVKDINMRLVRFDLGQSGRPLPPPSEGWLVIMQRFDFSLDFNRNWREYRNGFGELDLQNEFWLGNEAIHLLTSRFAHKLRIEMITEEALFFADYDSFSIGSEGKKYALNISGFSGNAGDSLTNKTVKGGWNHNGASFSTPDKDNDKSTTNCAKNNQAGWWFNKCWNGCLTCQQGDNLTLWKNLPSTSSLTGARMRIMRK